MNKAVKICLILVFMLVAIIVVGLIDFNINISSVSKESVEVEFAVDENSTYYSLSNNLKSDDLIRSEFWYKVYIKLTQPTKLQVGSYKLNKNMSVRQIIEVFEAGTSSDPNAVNITFKEGINLRGIANVISENTDNTYDDVLNTLKDTTYINSLIDEYWFLTDDILNSNIYYPLEGYLFPETYQVSSKYTVQDIFKVMLNQTDIILSKYKENIENSNYNIHEMVTLASIIELEAGNADDRAGVAGVFYNRLKSNWTLGSDVTTYYGSKIDDFSYSLTYNELDDCSNKYNTRCDSWSGLPVGPIDNPGEESLLAAISPTEHNYYYFVADCSGKTYLNYNQTGHNNTIAQLRASGNWCA